MSSAFDQLQTLEISQTALFLDFDGTLAPIVDRPELVQIAPRVLELVGQLHDRLDGALAIISGREIAVLDQFLSPYKFPASGVHGLEWRVSNSGILRRPIAETSLASVLQNLERMAAQHSGILVERKLGSIALHYRARPDLRDACRLTVEKAVGGRDDLVTIDGKMVIEVKGHSGDKGMAIQTIMLKPPFRDKTPVFIGDDKTDEIGFGIVNALGGISIKVGTGETCATNLLNDTDDVAAWLRALTERRHLKTMRGSVTG